VKIAVASPAMMAAGEASRAAMGAKKTATAINTI